MQRLNLIMTMLLIVFLSSCLPVNISQKSLRLVLYKGDTGRLWVDEKESGCWERNYHYGTDFAGPTSEFKEIPLEGCTEIIGHKTIDYGEAIKALNSARIDYSNCKSEQF